MLLAAQGKKLYWNEYGVGGGTNQDGEVKALTAADAAEYPFFGVFGTYTQAGRCATRCQCPMPLVPQGRPAFALPAAVI